MINHKISKLEIIGFITSFHTQSKRILLNNNKELLKNQLKNQVLNISFKVNIVEISRICMIKQKFL